MDFTEEEIELLQLSISEFLRHRYDHPKRAIVDQLNIKLSKYKHKFNHKVLVDQGGRQIYP